MRQLLTRPWAEDELKALGALVEQHEPVWRISRKLQRSQSGVRGKIVQLGLQVSPGALTQRDLRRAIFKTPASRASQGGC